MTLQLHLDVNHELIVDNFAGGGGASCGIEIALGRRVDIAINHDRAAVAMHQANHPETRHYCESVWDVDPREVCDGRPVGLLWLSPDCKHFSKAKGGKPVEKKIRGLAWVAVRWAATVHPRVICLENVEEFITWGPLIVQPDGTMRPCPRRKGREFKVFVNALKRHGYQVEWRELRACDYGAPTIRKRLFLIARRDGLPIVWPEPTHGPGKRLPWRTAAECIDFSIACPSIFERRRPLADATLRRVAHGVMRYVVLNPKPFIVNTRNGERRGQEPRVRSIDEPAWTITAQGSQHALVAPVLTEHANASSPRCMAADEPLRTICAQTKGGHHALVTALLAKHYGGHETPGWPLDKPISTLTTQDHHHLVTANLATLRGTSSSAPVDEPLHTISAGGWHHAEVRALLIKYYGNERDGCQLSEPMHTVTSRDRFGLVTVDGNEYAIADIGMRMLQPRELYRAQGFPETYIIEAGPSGLALTKTEQVRMVGNSVCPPLAAALVRANVPDMAVRRAA